MTQTFRNRSGFATTAALMFMTVVIAALLVLGTLLRTDAKRTLDESRDAQLRQLILAGAIDASANLDSGREVPKSWNVMLPDGVAGSVHVEMEARRAKITVTLAETEVSETVELENRG